MQAPQIGGSLVSLVTLHRELQSSRGVAALQAFDFSPQQLINTSLAMDLDAQALL